MANLSSKLERDQGEVPRNVDGIRVPGIAAGYHNQLLW